MEYKKGKKIESPDEFVKGRKYFCDGDNKQVYTFIENRSNTKYVRFYWNETFPSHNIVFKENRFYEAIPDISREIYEEVGKDYINWLIVNEKAGKHSDLLNEFLDHKFKPDLPGDYTGWVKDERNMYLSFYNNGVESYGFDYGGGWFNNPPYPTSVTANNNTEATPEEVYPRLKAEAEENQGLVEGVEVECLFDGEIEQIEEYKPSDLEYKKIERGQFWNAGAKLLNNKGEWAKPIEKKEVTREEAMRCLANINLWVEQSVRKSNPNF